MVCVWCRCGVVWCGVVWCVCARIVVCMCVVQGHALSPESAASKTCPGECPRKCAPGFVFRFKRLFQAEKPEHISLGQGSTTKKKLGKAAPPTREAEESTTQMEEGGKQHRPQKDRNGERVRRGGRGGERKQHHSPDWRGKSGTTPRWEGKQNHPKEARSERTVI